MNETLLLAADLRCLSLLFSYPDEQWAAAPMPQHSRGTKLLQEMRDATRVALQNEYVRLFINALPTLPCPPYGSVFLEGSVMGRSTVELARRYESLGMRCSEIADHLGVECEFLALLCSLALNSPEIADDAAFVTDHLTGWAGDFFDLVEQHDRLGPFRRSATFGRRVCASAHGFLCRNHPAITSAGYTST
jgi:TorA maturation chaperone TorD